MIIWGTKSKVISGPVIDDLECPHCHHTRFNSFGILKYLHVYWVPFVPKGRTPGIECQNCKHTVMGKDLPNELAGKIKQAVFTKKTVLSRCIGLFLALILIFAGVCAGYHQSQNEIAYLAHPKVHDVYVVNFTKIFKDADPKYKYGAMRIESVKGDKIEMQLSHMAYNRAKGVRKDIRRGKTDRDSYYDADTAAFSLQELQTLKAKGAIDSIDRDE